MKINDKSKEEILKELKALKKENSVLKAKNARGLDLPKQIGELFHINEEDYRNIFEDHAAVELIIDPKTGDIINANNAAAEYYGWSCEELRKMKIQEINILPAEEIHVNMNKVKNRSNYHFEFKHKKADNSIRDVDVFSANIKIAGKEYLLSIVYDITERKQTEEALRLSEERLQMTLEVNQIGIWEWDLNNDSWYASPTYYTMLGYTPVTGNDDRNIWIERAHPDDVDIVTNNIQRALNGESSRYQYEARVKNAKGEYRWIEVIGHAVQTNNENKPTRLIGIRKDITENKNAEYSLRKLQEDQLILLDNIPAWVFYKDTENRFIHVNKPFADVMGISKEKLEGKSMFDIYPKELAEAYWNDDLEVIATGKSKVNIIEQMTSVDGTIWVMTDKIPFLNSQGDIIGIIGFSINITERKIADDRIKKMNEELKELNFTKDKFFSIIAHDLKSPFQGLIGYSQILLEQYEMLSEEEKKDSINSIYQLSKNTFELLDNLLEWSRMQTGKLSFDPDVFNLYQELLPTIDMLMHAARKKNIAIDFRVDKRIIVRADKNMLSTVVRNLISNAIKFTNPDGEIIVSSARIGKYIELSVADNGIGINKKILNNLFKIDQNLSSVGTANEEGTGLGLILCKDMIQMHGGKIWAESVYGKGSKFTLSIPIKI